MLIWKRLTKSFTMKINNKNHPIKSIIIPVIFLLIVIATGYGVFSYLNKSLPFSDKSSHSVDNSTTKSSQSTNSGSSSNAKTSTSTTDQNTATNSKANANSASSSSTSSTSDAQRNLNFVFVDAGQYNQVFEIRAYVNELSKDGTCTYTFTKGTLNVVKTVSTTIGSTTTSCNTLDINISDFPSTGSWQLSASYKSTTGHATATKTVEIQ